MPAIDSESHRSAYARIKSNIRPDAKYDNASDQAQTEVEFTQHRNHKLCVKLSRHTLESSNKHFRIWIVCMYLWERRVPKHKLTECKIILLASILHTPHTFMNTNNMASSHLLIHTVHFWYLSVSMARNNFSAGYWRLKIPRLAILLAVHFANLCSFLAKFNTTTRCVKLRFAVLPAPKQTIFSKFTLLSSPQTVRLWTDYPHIHGQ